MVFHILVEGNQTLTKELQCSSYHKLSNESNVCSYITQLPNCQYDGGFIQYMKFVMCTFTPQYRPASYVILLFWMFYLFIILGVTAEDFFCPCLKSISKFLRMSDSLAGVTLLALGNGAPDIFSVIAAVNNRNPRTASMAFQELFGAGIFVTTVVSGSINISTSFKLARRPFLRDNIFYLVAVVWTFVVIYKREIQTAEATGFIVLYVLYVTIVIVGQIVNRILRKNVSKSRERLFTVNDSVENSSVNFNPPELVSDNPPDVDLDNEGFIQDEDNLTNGTTTIPPTLGTITEAPKNLRHPRHRRIRDMSLSTDFSTFNYSADVAHLFRENRHSGRTMASDLIFAEDPESLLRDFVRPINLFERLIGIRKVYWECQSLPSKIFSIIKVPIIFFLSTTCPVVDGDVQGEKWDKWLAMWHCLVSPIFVVFSLGVGMREVTDGFLVYHLVLISGSLLALLVFFISSHDYTPKFHVIFALFGFCVAVIWIKSTAQEVVNLLQTFGWITGLSYGIMGLTLLAWGNSIGDFISNLTMARNGAPRMAIAACYGGPLLNMLLGVGISCTISALSSGGHKKIIRGQTQYILSALVLAISLVSAVTLLPIHNFISSKYIGIYLFTLYALYLTLSILHEADVFNF